MDKQSTHISIIAGIIMLLSTEVMGQSSQQSDFEGYNSQSRTTPSLSNWDVQFSWEFQFFAAGFSMRDRIGANWAWGVDGSMGLAYAQWIHYPSKIRAATLEVYSTSLMLQRQLTNHLSAEIGYARIARWHDLHTAIEHRGALKYGFFANSGKVQVGIKLTLVHGPNGRGESLVPAETELQIYSSLLVVRMPFVLWKNNKSYKAWHLKH